MKKSFLILGLLVLFGASAVYGYNRRVANPDPNHNHADFAVWVDGAQMNFAQEKYMTEELSDNQLLALQNSPETGTGKDLTILKQYLHLHDMNGQVIHRHKPGLGFGDFLMSIGLTLTEPCLITETGADICNTDNAKWRFFVNGKEMMPFPSNYVFADEDAILLTYGADNEEVRRELALLTDNSCMYSKTCPGRGEPPTENCIADPTVPCIAP